MICLTPKQSQSFFCLPYTKQRKDFITEKQLFKEKWEWRIEPKNEKKAF